MAVWYAGLWPLTGSPVLFNYFRWKMRPACNVLSHSTKIPLFVIIRAERINFQEVWNIYCGRLRSKTVTLAIDSQGDVRLFDITSMWPVTGVFHLKVLWAEVQLCLVGANRCYYSKTCLKRNAIVPVFFFRFTGFRFTKGCVLIKQSTKNMIA